MKRLTAAALLCVALAGCAPATEAPADSGATATTTAAPAPSRPTRIRIPSQAVDVNVIDLSLQPNGEMQVPPDAADAGWYVNSPIPGQPGPAVIASHVNFKGVDGPFAHLDALKPGDEVMIEDAAGAEVSFAVDTVTSYPKNAFPTDTVYADTPDPELVLITCGGSYDASAHSYRDNIVARAKLKA